MGAGPGTTALPAAPAGGPIVPKPAAPDPRPFTLADRYIDAVQRGDLAMVKVCLDKGVDPATRDSIGRSALLLAVLDARSLETAEFLAGKGLGVDDADAMGRTPLMDAAGNGDVAIVKWLLSKGASLVARDAQGRTALFRAVLGGSRETVAALLDAGAAIDARDNFADTPLMVACAKGAEEVARLLVERGADRTLKDEEGRTAPERAAEGTTYCRGLAGKAVPPPAPATAP